jgi:SAM-dependent methyltransferase
MNKKQYHRTNSDNKYKGLYIYTSPKLHEYCATEILSSSTKNKRLNHVLDLGCGSGAFSQRLNDLGFETTAVDIDLSDLTLKSNTICVDLNQNFSHLLNHLQYDWITAIECIEHLENPLKFLREVQLLMNKNTRLMITIPNIYLSLALRSFFKNGSFVNWDIEQYWNTGHQTILTDWLIEQHFLKVGLRLEKKKFIVPIDPDKIFNSLMGKFIFNIFNIVICLINPNINKNMRLTDNILLISKKDT